jgi:hypothetical protein
MVPDRHPNAHDPLKPTCTACGAQPWQDCTHRKAPEQNHVHAALKAAKEKHEAAAQTLAELRLNQGEPAKVPVARG